MLFEHLFTSRLFVCIPFLSAVSRSIAGCFCKEIDGKYPQGKGVEKII